MSDYNVISIKTLPGYVTFSQPIPMATIKNNIKTWLKRWDEFWPKELTIDILMDNLQCVYIPYWILSARASGAWSASIGIKREKYELCGSCKGKRGIYIKNVWNETVFSKCGTCNGAGQVKKRYTEWFSQSGVANGSIDGRIYENTVQKIKLRCGKRNVKAKELVLESPFRSDIKIFQMKNVDDNAGLQIAEKLVRDAVYKDARRTASGLGKVRDLRVSHIQVDGVKARKWLYPIFLGSYEYENKLHRIEVDGITGKLHIVVPKSVRAKRTEKIMKIIGIVVAITAILAIIIGGILAVMYVIWWLGSNYLMLW
jgi:hypothetical protein